MAQILKEESREAIIAAAKQEFLEKGYKGASMREIAKKAHMTVGNLYRYYKNKEDINLTIVAPTFKEIDSLLKSLTSNSVSMETRVFNLKPDIKELKEMLDKLVEGLVDIYSKNKTEFNILMLHSRLNEEITNWFTDIVNSLIADNFIMEGINQDRDILSRSYAESVFAGIRVLFRDDNSNSDILKNLLKTYLRSFVYMLDSDLRKVAE